jgi:hypothetical protein
MIRHQLLFDSIGPKIDLLRQLHTKGKHLALSSKVKVG